MRKAAACLAITTIIIGTSPAMAQDTLRQFTLEDLNFGGVNARKFVPKNMYLTWWGDQLMYQDAEETGIVDMKSGEKTPVAHISDIDSTLRADTGDTIQEIHSAMDALYPYPDQTLLMLKGAHTRLLYDWEKRQVVWKQRCEGEQFADWNPTSRAVAFVRDNQLCVTTADGTTTTITSDGSREIVYGQEVHRNEFGIYKGTFWNANGTLLAFYRMDQTMVADYPQVNTFEREAALEPDKYPMAGMTSHKVAVGIYNTATGDTLYLKTGDPTDRYFTNIAWAPDSKLIYMIELNRDQTKSELTAYDPATGEKTGVIYTEEHPKYVHPMNPVTFLPWDPSLFILQSEKDGYNHLYLMNTKGETVRQLTSGEWVVIDLIGFNTSKKSVIILSTEASPIQNNLYSVDIKSGKRTALDDGKGVHAAIYTPSGHRGEQMLSASGKYLYDKYSEPDVPRNIDITSTDGKSTTRLLTAPNPWEGYNTPEFRCGTIKADDDTTDLYYRMVMPIDFDPDKKYPTVVYVYGGPGLRNVEASWHYDSRSWETYMAQKGYLLFILDNRGSCDRGRDFEQVTFRHLGVEEMKDQLRGVEFLKSLPYVDTDRLGVHGWSYGGFMTVSLMTTYPDVFKVGVAGGPVIDWKWYEVMYGERYMDTPESNPEGYAECSCLPKAKNLKGRLELIIGMNDPVVVPQHCLMFINACTEAGTQPDFFVYPGEGHNMMGHKSVHLHERITRYFEDYLK